MITYLNIENLGIIDNLEVEFDDKLNILTGETGAGKTLIVESLNLLSGSRFSKEMIKKDKDYLLVEASISIKKSILNKIIDKSVGLDDIKDIIYEDNLDNENIKIINIVVKRKVEINGKNTCKINGRIVSVNELRKFMLYIIDIHGQHENQNIMINDVQRDLLDRFAYKDINIIYNNYIEKYFKYRNIKKILENDLKDDKHTKRQIDLLKFQIEEIEEANLKLGEDEEIELLYKQYNSSEKISSTLELTKQILSDDVLKQLSMMSIEFESISMINEKYLEYLKSIKSAFYELEEVSYDINSELNNKTFDEKEILKVESRLDKINSLKRKYGNTIEEIFSYLKEIKDEYDNLINFEENKKNLEDELTLLSKQMDIIAENLISIRKKYAEKISNKITRELHDLEMKTSTFKILVEVSKEFNKYGKDEVNFLIMTNKGSDYLPLEKIASGGEMSRIMLAIKTVLSEEDDTPILVFDEIDTGISGITGQVAGEKLEYIAKKRQVLCVTHLATLAAQGDSNYFIYKENDSKNVRTVIKKLNEKETVNELARISSGVLTEEALEYAEELRSRKFFR